MASAFVYGGVALAIMEGAIMLISRQFNDMVAPKVRSRVWWKKVGGGVLMCLLLLLLMCLPLSMTLGRGCLSRVGLIDLCRAAERTALPNEPRWFSIQRHSPETYLLLALRIHDFDRHRPSHCHPRR